VWSRLDRTASDVVTFNLDRRPLVFAVFGWLAEAAPGRSAPLIPLRH
jgi:DNA polymerase-3 subunit delta'